MSELSFRRLLEGDLPLLHDWLQREHVRRWWRPAATLAGTREHYGPALRGEEPAEHWLILVDGRPAGMVETYLAGDFPEWATIVGADAGAAGVDLLIGDEELTGQGLGPRILSEFVASHVAAPVVVATVEEQNRRSWRAYEKAGFVHVRDVEEDGRPHRLLRLDRRGRPAARPQAPGAGCHAGSASS